MAPGATARRAGRSAGPPAKGLRKAGVASSRPAGSRGRARGRRGAYDDDEGAVAPRRGLTPPVIVAIVASVVVLVGGIIIVVTRQGDDEPTPQTPTPVVSTPQPVEASRETRILQQRRRLEELEDRLRNEPDSLGELEVLVHGEIVSGRLLDEVKGEFQALGMQIKNDLERRAKREFDKALAGSKQFQEKGQYQLALEAWRPTPAVVYTSQYHQDWVREERKAEGYATKGRYWSMIVEQVSSYLKKDNQDIAEAILEENVRENEFGEFVLIWNERMMLLEEIQRAGSEKIQAIIDLETKQREERLAILRAQREKEREEKWKYALEALDWEPLISIGGDLENWQQLPKNIGQMGDPDADHYPWKNIEEDGEPVLQADSSDWDGEIWVAMNGNRWMDWALQFEVQVPEGKLTLDTRATFASGGMGGMPSGPSDKAEGIVLDSDTYGSGEWVKIFVFVRGREIRWLEGEDENDLELKKTIQVDHEKGGFRFLLDEESSCRIRRVQLKLVHALKRGEDDAESDYADDEDEDDDL